MFIEKLIVTSETNSTKFALELGGTLSGEHGIGLLKKAFLEEALGEVSVDVQRKIKDALDPAGILNPGKVL